MTQAHFQILTLNTRLREWVPEHEPREQDPQYHLFHAAKKEMKRLNLPCWRCGVHYAELVEKGAPATTTNPLGAHQLEAHHSDIEFSLLNAIDVGKWWGASHRDDPSFMVETFSKVDDWLSRHPQYANEKPDLIFTQYMESEGNLMQLCDVCHRSKDQGIHHIPYPDWRVGPIVWKPDQPPHLQAT